MIGFNLLKPICEKYCYWINTTLLQLARAEIFERKSVGIFCLNEQTSPDSANSVRSDVRTSPRTPHLYTNTFNRKSE